MSVRHKSIIMIAEGVTTAVDAKKENSPMVKEVVNQEGYPGGLQPGGFITIRMGFRASSYRNPHGWE